MLLSQAFEYSAQRFADRTALISANTRISYATLGAQVKSVACALAAQYRKGERVVLYTENCSEYLLLQLALERAGLVRVPANYRYTASELKRVIDSTDCVAIFHDKYTIERVHNALSSSGTDVDVIDVSSAEGTWQSLLQHTGNTELPVVEMDDLCSINFTSGTSGTPKGVMLSFSNWRAVCQNMLINRSMLGDDVVAHIGPFTHASGTYCLPFWLKGATNIVPDEKGVAGLLRCIERYQVTVFNCVPTLLTRIVNDARLGDFDLSSLRCIYFGGEAMPKNTLQRAIELFGPIIEQSYGLTEAMMTVATYPAAEYAQAVAHNENMSGLVGYPYTFVNTKIRDKSGEPVPNGEVGELTVQADHVMQGYWRMPDETATALRYGWLWSGDLALRDQQGRLRLVGRSKDLIISGGFNIYPADVEQVLNSVHGIQASAVIGLPDLKWGEVVIAFIVPAADAAVDPSELKRACAEPLGFKTPKRWIVVRELPTTQNDKVDKAALRQGLEQGEFEYA